MRTRKQFTALLKRTRGYVSLARRIQPVHHSRVTSPRSWNLAEAIVNRYAVIERRWPLMALLFEKPDDAQVLVSNTYHTSHPSIYMNPRVILRMLVSHKEEINRVVTEPTPAQSSFVKEAAAMTLAATPRQQLVMKHEEAITRIARRALRDEAPVGENARQSARSPARFAQTDSVQNGATRRAPMLARVFRHAAKKNNDATAVAMNVTDEKQKPRTVAGRELSTAAAVPPQVDITRITDQVIQALDRRIVAQRERLGRV